MNTSLRDTPSEDLAAILLTPTGRDTTLIRGVLEPEGIPCRPVGTVAELLEAVGSDYSAGVLVIAEEALDPASARDLAGFLGGEPAWSDLPVLLLGRTSFSARRLLRQIRRRSTQVLGRPLSPATLRASVHSAVEIRRRQYEARALLFDAHSLNDQLRERATQLRRLSLELSDAEERERKRLAVYVHDDLQQILAGIKFHLDVTEQRLDDKKRAGKTIALVKELVMDAIEGSRTLAHELSPPVLQRNGLLAGLRWLTGRVNNLRGLAVHLETDVEREPANPATVIFLFRAAQELLLNVSKHAETDQAWLVLRDLEKSIVLTVRDNGKGFDPQELENPEQGKGFGLFSLQERVELLGGSASIESAPGEGTVVTLRVPLESYRWRESTPGSPISTPPASEGSTGDFDGSTQLRLLLVDDHTLMRTGLRVMLAEQPGIEILGEYGDGLEAVKAASTLQPDVILMDVSMPRMDGIEATKVIKQEHPKIRIIALSMFDDPETKQKMIDAGAERFVTKSGPGEELVKAIFQAPRSR
jgi:signal transduction histidine kinase